MDTARIEQFKAVLALDPEDVTVLFGLGQAYLEADQPAEAEQVLRRAIELKPDYTAALHLLGRALEKLGQMDQALKIYEQGIVVGERTRDMIPLEKMRARVRRLKKAGAGT
ncbi:MAG: tetratricopeptide repeat protein [Nitrospirae bacterium]|nr:tetratricopeptide repeat protein [Nitrospirota bacterium]